MKPEDKVPTLEQCKRLVELGVVLETEKYWDAKPMDPSKALLTKTDSKGILEFNQERINKILRLEPGHIFPAPDVAELGVVFRSKHLDCFTRVVHGSNTVTCHIYNKYVQTAAIIVIEAKTEAQARCAAFICLIENKH